MTRAAPARVRCAIYTRKSSEEGLDRSFNSLHAQREACEAYVLSQSGEGWRVLPTAYDDGGYSGGSLDRPALRRLLADIQAAMLDTVVVYKIDRLTRSLADFAKIVEIFDAKGASFVSVTQAFNTTTSMGRLTLNVLLSFAQFEREVTGERIRDKIEASKKKGMWMGGNLPLGYDAPTDQVTRALAVNPAEAEIVRLIFARYLELGSVHELQRWLSEQDIRSKAWISSRGRKIGGCPFGRGALFHLLKNRTYVGEIPHRTCSYPGAHPAIVDIATFEHVQARLAQQTRRASEPRRVATAPLKGLIFDAAGEPMSPVHTHGRRGKVHRYYVSTSLLRGRRADASDGVTRRVPGPALEALVRDALARLADNPSIELPGPLGRVEVRQGALEMLVRRSLLLRNASGGARELKVLRTRLAPVEDVQVDAADEAVVRIVLPCLLRRSGGVVRITDSAHGRAQPDETLIGALKAAHALVAEGSGEPVGWPESFRLSTAPDNPYKRNLIRLAFLAPDIQAAILDGRQPIGLNRQRLVLGDIPPAWADQRRLFNLS